MPARSSSWPASTMGARPMISELETADFETILAPLAGDEPIGTDLRQNFTPTSIYFRLRDARAQARDAERQADSLGGDDNPPTLWRPVVAMGIEILKENAKDLEVATWLTEGLVRIAGPQGLMAGASVIAGLVDRYWEGLYPLPEGEDMEPRVAAVAGLSGQGVDGTLMQPLRKITLFRRPDGLPFSVWQFQAAVELSGIIDPARRAQRIDSGVLPFEDVEKEARLAGAPHWAAQRKIIAAALAAWKDMERAFDEKAGQASPPANRVRELLEFVLETCNRFAPADGAPENATAATPEGAVSAGAVAGAPPGVIAGREQALHQLAEIANWFTRNEPGSPIGFTLQEAVRRARMGWPELVAELVADETARHSLLTSVGIKPPSTQS